MQERKRLEECATVKEVCDALMTHHEGTLHVRETRIYMGLI